MAQVDFINYFSILLWFFLLFFLLYIINYSYTLPNVFSTLFTRSFYYILKFFKVKNKFSYFSKYKNNNSNVRNNFNLKPGVKIILYAS